MAKGLLLPITAATGISDGHQQKRGLPVLTLSFLGAALARIPSNLSN
jgi:hypothetical protein